MQDEQRSQQSLEELVEKVIGAGKVRVQVIAHGFKTYGNDVTVDQPTIELTIKMEKPAEQLSIYK